MLNPGRKRKAEKQIKFLIYCPPAGLGELKTKSRGKPTPKVKTGLSSDRPSKIAFGAGSGELEIGGVKKGAVTESLKVMGYEAGELGTVDNP